MSVASQQGVKEYSCHICYFICVSPVTCTNGHLFCRSCVSRWISTNSQCPTCRSKLEPSDLKAVLGADALDQDQISQATRKNVRTTRFNFLRDFYEDEISLLLDEIDKLTERLGSKEFESRCTQTEEQLVESSILTAATGQVEKAIGMYAQLKTEMEHVKKVNCDLEMEKRTLSRELKAVNDETNGRSPYKCGRFVVNSLEKKIEKLEKENLQLTKALDKQDRFISDLQLRIPSDSAEELVLAHAEVTSSQNIVPMSGGLASLLLPSPLKFPCPKSTMSIEKPNLASIEEIASPPVSSSSRSRIPVSNRSRSPSPGTSRGAANAMRARSASPPEISIKSSSASRNLSATNSPHKGKPTNPRAWLKKPTARSLSFPKKPTEVSEAMTDLNRELLEDFRDYVDSTQIDCENEPSHSVVTSSSSKCDIDEYSTGADGCHEPASTSNRNENVITVLATEETNEPVNSINEFDTHSEAPTSTLGVVDEGILVTLPPQSLRSPAKDRLKLSTCIGGLLDGFSKHKGSEFSLVREEPDVDDDLSDIFSDTEKRIAERSKSTLEPSILDISSISSIKADDDLPHLHTQFKCEAQGSLNDLDDNIVEDVSKTLAEINELRMDTIHSLAARCAKRKIEQVDSVHPINLVSDSE
jgi:hypothetical protein